MCRLDVPAAGTAAAVTQFYAAGALFALTPSSEAAAREAVAMIRSISVHPFDLTFFRDPASLGSAVGGDWGDGRWNPEEEDDDDRCDDEHPF